jgi:hypothetical protein
VDISLKGMMILVYLPFQTYEIKSPLSVIEVNKRMGNNIETQMPLFSLFYNGRKKFKGEINEDQFLISRIIRYRNSFLPIIIGDICADSYGSKIRITMRLNKFVLGFWIFWMAMAFFIFLGTLPTLLSDQRVESLIPLFMLAFGYLLCIIAFNMEASMAKKLLKDILNV